MPKHKQNNEWKIFLLAPITLATAVLALWFSVAAAQESLRYARVTDQILLTVSAARELAFSSSTTAEQATLSLLDRLSHMDSIRIQPVEGEKFPQLMNPWGKNIKVIVTPAQRQVAFQTVVSAPICRKMILFYGKDVSYLGVLKMEAREKSEGSPISKIIYDSKDKNIHNAPTPTYAKIGCGAAEQVEIIMTFSL